MDFRRIKKLLVVMLTLAMVLSTAACGDSKEETKKESSSKEVFGSSESKKESEVKSEQAEETNYDPLGKYDETITVSVARYAASNNQSLLPSGDTMDDNPYDDWALEMLNIEVVNLFEAESDEYKRQTSLTMATGEMPDTMMVFGIDTVRDMYEAGMLADLTQVYENYACDEMKAIYDSYDGEALGMCTFDGQLMAIPSVSGVTQPMIWIRQDWVNKLGLKVDEDGDGIISRDELVMVAKAFIEKDPGNSGKPVGIAALPLFTGNFENTLVTLVTSFGSYWGKYMPNSDGTLTFGNTTSETKEALAWLADLYKDGILDSQFGTRDNLKELFVNGQTGIGFGPWHYPGWAVTDVYAVDPGAEFTPYNIDNGNGKVNWPSDQIGDGRFVVVSKDCEHPEAAIKLLNLFNVHYSSLSVEERQELVPGMYNYGELGISTHMRPLSIEVMASDSVIQNQYKNVEKYLNGEITEADLSSTNVSTLKSMDEWENNRTGMEPGVWGHYHSRRKGIPHMSKLQDQDSYNIVYPLYAISQVAAENPVDLEKLTTETFTKIIVGQLSIDAFDKYVEDWKKQGGDAILEELATKLN